MSEEPSGYTFAYSEAALEYLEGMQKKLRGQVMEKIERLGADPCPPGCKIVRGMDSGGEEPVYRIRSGDYRALYVVRERVITILDVGHRKDVYD